LYDPASEWYHSTGACEDITRPVIQEGQIHFKTQILAESWLESYNPLPETTVWTNDGLVVRFGLEPRRYQLNVDVVRICVDGQPPKALTGARDGSIRVTGSALFDCVRVSDEVMTDALKTFVPRSRSRVSSVAPKSR
jgi:hypothetical protein